MAKDEGTKEEEKDKEESGEEEENKKETIPEKIVRIGNIALSSFGGIFGRGSEEGDEIDLAVGAATVKLYSTAEGDDSHAVFGMPPLMNDVADPNNRAYNKFLMADARIMQIVPGRPKFFQAKTTDGEVYRDEELEGALGFGEDATDDAIMKYLTSSFKNSPDFRYYGFEADFQDYQRYVSILLSTLYAKMRENIKESGAKNSLGQTFRIQDEYKTKWFESGVSFLLNNDVSINEVASNDFGPSKVEGIAKTASGLMKEVKFLMGKADGKVDKDIIDAAAEENEELQEGVSEVLQGGMLKKIMGYGSIGGVDKVSTLVNGSHLLFPHVWNDSVFDRTYNITMRFYSPYGDPVSILRNVLTPFISILTLALPRQDKFMGYTSPFICRVDCPGYFQSDMAVITSLTWTKGGPNKLFTKDGYPREIEVSISVRDLYPVLMLSPDFSKAKASNKGMMMFIDNLAGLGVSDFNFDESIASYIGRKVNWFQNIPSSFKSAVSDKVSDFISLF